VGRPPLATVNNGTNGRQLRVCERAVSCLGRKADSTLVALGRAFDSLAGEIDLSIHGAHLEWSTLEQFDKVHNKIIGTAATTMEGFL
jgi:hypothetical protein